MGQILKARCTQCNFEKDFYVGGGLKDCEITTMLAALPKEGQRTLTVAARRNAKQISITKKLCICDSCRTIYTLPVVEYTLEGKREELRGLCPQCNGIDCHEVGEDHQVKCPDCGTEIQLQIAGHWD